MTQTVSLGKRETVAVNLDNFGSAFSIGLRWNNPEDCVSQVTGGRGGLIGMVGSFFGKAVEATGIMKNVDLDSAVLMYDANFNYIGSCDFTKLRPMSGIAHSGDDLTGERRLSCGSNERIDVDMTVISARVEYLVPCICAFRAGVKLTDASNASASLILNGKPAFRISVNDIRQFGNSQTLALGVVKRVGSNRIDFTEGMGGFDTTVPARAAELIAQYAQKVILEKN